MADHERKPDATDVAKQVAERLTLAGQEYAIGGAIALGFWAEPRGTIDVDFTLFMAADKPGECVWLLQELGCEFEASVATRSLNEHGYCAVTFDGLRVDVFLPIVPFYEAARQRRQRVILDGQELFIWDAESLTVFKMMFFRRKDLADVEQMIRVQGDSMEYVWIRQWLVELYGKRDPRVSQWDDLVNEVCGPN